MPGQSSPFIPPGNMRKPLVSWCYQEYKNGTLAWNGLNEQSLCETEVTVKLIEKCCLVFPLKAHIHKGRETSWLNYCYKQCLFSVCYKSLQIFLNFKIGFSYLVVGSIVIISNSRTHTVTRQISDTKKEKLAQKP